MYWANMYAIERICQSFSVSEKGRAPWGGGGNGSAPWRLSSASPLQNGEMVSTVTKKAIVVQICAVMLTKTDLPEGDPAVHAETVGEIRKGCSEVDCNQQLQLQSVCGDVIDILEASLEKREV